MKYIVVTGASGGIGFETVRYLLEKGFYVFGSVRTGADAAKLAGLFPRNFTPLIFDVTDEAAMSAAAEQVKAMLGEQNLAGLVNNAGMVVTGPILHMPKEKMRQQFEVNTFGPLVLCQLYFPLLRSRDGKPPGRIVNVSSLSAEIALPFMGPYSASKRALSNLAHALRREFYPYGIPVIDILPGRVKTGIVDTLAVNAADFSGTDFEEGMTRYLDSAQYLRDRGLSPEVVAATIYRALSDASPRLRYVRPYKYFSRWKIPVNLPTRVLDRLLAKRLRLLPGFLKNKNTL
ncbi:MAG: SDR family NAD(P)-dependent oxidoreductase [Saprospiraceae bacterium]|nr:SDR family NAD(P)-dependent oxidoreductase [Saprospiraceae bacterium]MDZ4702452.1 SDR family NAD(P)-dependent oxidoreductase [Saprospiraceae bacterium]